MKQRIDFIDLAKGFCIILVVFTHIIGYYCLDPHILYPLSICRMPLYFLLSGLFFKQYSGFGDFFKRKVNKLLIPFVFFYLTTSVALPIVLRLVGYEVRNDSITGLQSLWAFYSPEIFSNMPIWFLLCLFEINILFYMICSSLDVFKKIKVGVLICICVFIGVIGVHIGNNGINLPMYVDTALSAMPFFCLGYILNHFTNIMMPNKYDKWNWVIIIACALYSILFSVKTEYSHNDFYGNSAWWVYTCGISGVMFFILISKKIKTLPLVSYWGRYSIIILLTHNLVIQFLLIIIRRFNIGIWLSIFVTLLITMLLYLLIIPFMKKYFPYVIAQKDVIKVNK